MQRPRWDVCLKMSGSCACVVRWSTCNSSESVGERLDLGPKRGHKAALKTKTRVKQEALLIEGKRVFTKKKSKASQEGSTAE